MAKTSTIFPVILAGGQSSRLFPFNKVLSDLTGSGRTLLQQSFDRLVKAARSDPQPPLAPHDQVYLLTIRDFVGSMRKQLSLPASRFLTDPVRRGTWPALLWAMAHLRRQGPQAVLAVVTADHVIPDVAAFRRSVSEAINIAQSEQAIVLVGVEPSERAEEWRSYGAVRTRGTKVVGFEEKPTVPRAADMIAEGGWLWNAGMFFYRISVAESALELYQPAMAETYRKLCDRLAKRRKDEAAALYAEFPAKIRHPLDPARSVDNTIDYAILTPLAAHPSGGLSVLAAERPIRGWADVGQWDALRQILAADAQGNIRLGAVQADATVRSSILAADRPGRLRARGLDGLVAAFAKGTLLVLPEREVGQIKAFVQAAQTAGPGAVFEQNCVGCQFDVKGGRVLAYGLENVRVKLSKAQVVLEGAVL